MNKLLPSKFLPSLVLVFFLTPCDKIFSTDWKLHTEFELFIAPFGLGEKLFGWGHEPFKVENQKDYDRYFFISGGGTLGLFQSGNISIAMSISSNTFVTTNDPLTVAFSVGGGMYYNFGLPYQLDGLFVMLYPVYGLPVQTYDYTPYYKWKIASDIGFQKNFIYSDLLAGISLSACLRTAAAFRGGEIIVRPDIVFSIGFYYTHAARFQ